MVTASLRLRLVTIYLLGVAVAIVISECIVAGLHALFWKGGPGNELLVAGFITPLLDASIILFFILATVSRLKDTSRELFNAKQMLEEITGGISESILLISKDFKVLWGNKTALRQTGLTLRELTMHTCYTASHHALQPCDHALNPCPIKDTGDGKCKSAEHVHFDKDGRKSVVEVSAYPIKDESGETTSYVHITRDITERKKIEHALEVLSRTDELTGLANRRAFDAFMDEEWRRASRTNKIISLLMIDVDFFKKYNDHYGHPSGDEVLKSVARIVKSFARRPGDIAVRYGGEEFVIVLSAGKNFAVLLAEKLLKGVEALNIEHCASDIAGHLTVSIGIASCHPQQSASPRELIARVDAALYDAKKKGRNRIAIDG